MILLFTVYGAKELQLSFPEYYNSGMNIAKAQMRLQEKFNHDCLYNFLYAAVEYKAFGGEIVYKQNGPPESGIPVFKTVEDLLACELPSPSCEAFKPVIEAEKILFAEKGDEIPIINAVIAPLSLTVMLLGFEKWIDCISFHPDKANEVVSYLIDYSITLANTFLEHGATFLAYFNPLASPEIIRSEEFDKITFHADKKFFNKVKGPTVYAFAGARCETLLPKIIDEIKAPGACISYYDNLAAIKEKYGSKAVLIGNLNNIKMLDWNEKEVEENVKRCIDEAATGGGFILSDHHGDLPLGISDETFFNIVKTRDQLGRY